MSRSFSKSVSCVAGVFVSVLGALGAQDRPLVVPAPGPLLEPLALSEATVQELALPLASEQAFQIRVDLGGVVRTLLVEPHDVRAPGFRLWVEDERGLHEEPAPPPVTFRGVVRGEPGSAVGVSLIDGQLSGVILNQFRNHWNANQGGVQRDIAHLLTGFPSSGTLGIAYLSTVCNRPSAYGVSWYQSNLTVRVAIVSHELGHGWSAPHCTGSGCRIMCAFIGGCSGIITSFGMTSKNRIISFRNTRPCLN